MLYKGTLQIVPILINSYKCITGTLNKGQPLFRGIIGEVSFFYLLLSHHPWSPLLNPTYFHLSPLILELPLSLPTYNPPFLNPLLLILHFSPQPLALAPLNL
jgi:hypothetical protein